MLTSSFSGPLKMGATLVGAYTACCVSSTPQTGSAVFESNKKWEHRSLIACSSDLALEIAGSPFIFSIDLGTFFGRKNSLEFRTNFPMWLRLGQCGYPSSLYSRGPWKDSEMNQYMTRQLALEELTVDEILKDCDHFLLSFRLTIMETDSSAFPEYLPT
jgi:hypothetical protein